MTSPSLEPVLGVAADEARMLGHGYLGPEHLLIAVVQRASASHAAVLARHGLTPDVIRDAVGAVVGAPARAGDPVAIPQASARARRALEHAAEHAALAGSEPPSADDLLAGLLAADVAPGAVIGAVLDRRGVELSALRRDLLGPCAGE